VIALCRRFGSLSPVDRRLVIEAAALLALVWVGLRVFPFPVLQRILSRYAKLTGRTGYLRGSGRLQPALGRGPQHASRAGVVDPPKGGHYRDCETGSTLEPGEAKSAANAGRVAWAITAAAARFLAPMTCLTKALATDTMLRRKGLASELRLGVRRGDGADPLEAHAWVECGGDVVIGEIEDLPEYVVLSSPECS